MSERALNRTSLMFATVTFNFNSISDSIGDTDTTLENLLQSFNLQLDIPKVKNP